MSVSTMRRRSPESLFAGDLAARLSLRLYAVKTDHARCIVWHAGKNYRR
ncbi:hypothetical protein KCP69_12395 [Salmonella enterica subsp. enterica]|nr:hypothetical protein KCP69_12395 [Salmonella enterica subsp. enterica]